MKIVFFGSPYSAVTILKKLLKTDHSIELVITQPDRPSGRGRKHTASPVKIFAESVGIPVCQPRRIRKDQDTLKRIEKISPDINVVVAFGQIMPASIIYLPRYNSVNIHYSLLPKYRGASPVQWALLNGERRTGVSLFILNEKMDEGDILTQAELEIARDETFPELETRLTDLGGKLLIDTLDRIREIHPIPQIHQAATYAPLIKKEDGLVDWNKEAEHIQRQIQAFTPWPSVFAFFNGKRIKFIYGKIKDSKAGTVPPGTVTSISREGIAVRCGDGREFLIVTLQPENKKPMDAFSFAQGSRISPGTTFT